MIDDSTSTPPERLRRLIEGMYEAIDADDVDALGEAFASKAVYHRAELKEPLRGRETIVWFYREERKLTGSHDIERIVVDASAGAAWGCYRGRRPDGSSVFIRFADCFTFDDGPLITMRRSHLFEMF